MRGLPPSDFTKQEKIIAEVLSDYGLRYKEQENIGRYYADFFVPEINTVIEADGIYGHLKKADAKRDKALIDCGVNQVIHISSSTKEKVKKELTQKLWQV